MILLKSFDEQNNFNNAIVPLSLNIDKLIFVYHHQIDRSKFEYCTKVINKYKDIEIHFTKVDEQSIRQYFSNETIVDVSANKYLSLVLCEMALKRNNRIIYFDEEEKCIKDYRKHEVLTSKIFNFQIEDIITLNGGRIISSMHNPVKNRETIELIYKTIEYSKNNYSNFISFVSKINNLINYLDHKDNDYYLDETIIKKITSDENYRYFKDLNLFTIKDNTLSFFNNDIRRIFMVSGTFLENYIYNKLVDSKLFDDVLMSCNIEFSRTQNLSVRCELDCLVIKDNCLLFTSIKSNKVDPSDLNEIKVHNVMFGNEYSKPVICLYSELSENRPLVYAKGEELGIYIIEKNDFENDVASRFLEIINNSYQYNNGIWQR